MTDAGDILVSVIAGVAAVVFLIAALIDHRGTLAWYPVRAVRRRGGDAAGRWVLVSLSILLACASVAIASDWRPTYIDAATEP